MTQTIINLKQETIMKKTIKSVMLIAAVAMFASCSSMTTPIAATSNPVGNKCGVASTTKILGIFGGSSNMGINKAAKLGGITQISHVDFVKKSFLGFLVQTYQTVVYGE